MGSRLRISGWEPIEIHSQGSWEMGLVDNALQSALFVVIQELDR